MGTRSLVGGQTPDTQPAELLTTLFAKLGTLTTQQPDCAEPVADLMNVIGQIAGAGHLWCQDDRLPVPHKLRRQSGPSKIEYFLYDGVRGLRLAEHREGNPKDFYVMEEDFTIAVNVIVETKGEKTKFEALHAAFINQGGSQTASGYPLRVMLRVLRSQKPALIKGQRGGYQITIPENKFRSQAKQLWNNLPRRRPEAGR